MIVALFDIDGTLVRTDRAGSRAMSRAFEDVFGIADAFAGIEMAGRTDCWILDLAASRVEVALTPAGIQAFRDAYAPRLRETLQEPGTRQILPGVRALLEAVNATPTIFPALLTGNGEHGARIKLEHFGLWAYFRCGAFGDDAVDRHALFAAAVSAASSLGIAARPEEVVVIGDTEFDVACARAAGARSIAVATGPVDAATLRQTGADMVVEDLTDTARILAALKKGV